MNVLRLSYEPEDDFHGELFASIDVPDFSGRSSAWFNRSEIQEFAQRLVGRPLTDDEPVRIRGGYFDDNGEIAEVLLGISVCAKKLSGVVVRVELASEERGDEQQLQQRASLGFSTDYARLDRFRGDLIRMLDDADVEAVLKG